MTKICWINTKGNKEGEKKALLLRKEFKNDIFNLNFSVFLFLLSLVCGALRGKTKAFPEMEANFKVRYIPFSLNLSCRWLQMDSQRKK